MVAETSQDDSMEVTSLLSSQLFEELEEYEDSIHKSIEANSKCELMEAAPVAYIPRLLPRATILKKIKPVETSMPAPQLFKKMAQAYRETLEMVAFWKITNKTTQKLKEAIEYTFNEARKALPDIVNLTTTYYQQRETDQATTTHNLEALKDELLSHIQQQYNDFEGHLN
ncbi:hypothetical protein BDZ91DRAFT_804102 [Kalaharituber pfeilii]|nr:hypothetical protein BDZ91DRAFT_804102 [Kalaharituber pfeilii]